MSFAQVDTGPSEGVARSGLVARNSLLNFAGQAIPLLIGIAAIRVTVRALGAEAFGVLTLVWIVVRRWGGWGRMGVSVLEGGAEAVAAGFDRWA